MRYLVTIDYADPSTSISSQQLLQLIAQAGIPTLEACASLESEGAILAGGVTAHSAQVVLIVATPSNADLNQLVQRLPAWGTLRVTVTPLQGFAERAAQDRAALDQQRAAAEPLHRAINQHLGQLRDMAGG